MLTPDQFATRWQRDVAATSAAPEHDELVKAPRELIAGRPLTDESRRFLTEAGLPASCAPCLMFDDLAHGLRRLWEVFSPVLWTPDEKRGLEHYGVIGSDGSGN